MSTSILQNILTGQPSEPRRIVFYAPEGTGKTTWAGEAPAAYIIRTEDGCKGLRDGIARTKDLCTSIAEINAHLTALATETHDYKTVVIDSLSPIEPMIWQQTCARHNTNNIQKVLGGFFKGYEECVVDWREFVKPLDYLCNFKGMNVILLAHARVARIKNPDGNDYGRFDVRLEDKAADFITGWADDVLFADKQVFTSDVGEGARKRSIGVSDNVPVIYTKSRPSHRAKNRLYMPETIPMPYDPARPGLGWAEYAKYFKK